MPSPDVPDPDSFDPSSDLPRMTLGEHLDELRGRLMRSVVAVVAAMLASFFAWRPIWEFVRQPYVRAARMQGIENAQLLSVDPGEGFLSILKLCFLVGVVVASPVVLWQMWGFIAAGLYKHERRIVRVFFPVSMALFALGVVMAYVILIPFGMRFLIGWNVDMQGVASEFRIQTYISTCLTMVFGMALLFELPLVMLFLQATNMVSQKTFWKGWRIAVLLAFVVGMFLTDPSPVTQVLMAVPVVGLYFLGCWGGSFVGEDRKAFRWYHAWPLVLGAVLIALMLAFADDINVSLFGVADEPAAVPEAASPEPGDQGP